MKSVVITGSTRGIGLGLAKEFLKRDCQVTISGRSDKSVAAAIDLLASLGKDRLHGHPCEVSKYDQVQALWDSASQRFGKVDVWISNAGIVNEQAHDAIFEMSPESLRDAVDTNLVGSMFCSRVAVGGMLKQANGGHYYNFEGFGSNGRQFRKGLTPYATSKSGLRYFTRALAKEVEGTKVRVGALSPGIVVTDLLLGPYEDKPEELVKAKKIFNILADTVETVTPYLVDGVMSDDKNGSLIAWLTPAKAMGRFMKAPFARRDLFSDTVPPPAD